MKSSLIGFALLTGFGLSAAPAQAELPDDVVEFIGQREQCDQLRAETDADDPAAQGERDVNYAAFCRGTDAQLAALRAQYSNNAEVQDSLANYEDVIETPQKEAP